MKRREWFSAGNHPAPQGAPLLWLSLDHISCEQRIGNQP